MTSRASLPEESRDGDASRRVFRPALINPRV
jgi:hypothetical protein